MHCGLTVAVLALSGCAATVPRPDPIPHTLDSAGVQLVGSPLRIDFGRAEASALASFAKLNGGGPVARGVCAASGRVFADFDDTRLIFAGGAFAGWARPGAGGGVPCDRVFG